VNTGDPVPGLFSAECRVREIQAKLHRWASDDPHRRFDDLYNLVCDPAFVLVAWDQVRHNKGARSAGVDGRTAYSIEAELGVARFCDRLREQLKARSFRPVPVRERRIPKANGKTRRLGIATVTDRVVQASLKLVLEPIFEADFLPCSYGFRPGRRAHDAVAEVHHFTSRTSASRRRAGRSMRLSSGWSCGRCRTRLRCCAGRPRCCAPAAWSCR
jgi:RNA-directed DNA polymerase